MTSAQVVETSVTNNSSFQNYPHPDDHTIRTNDRVVVLTGYCCVRMFSEHGDRLSEFKLPIGWSATPSIAFHHSSEHIVIAHVGNDYVYLHIYTKDGKLVRRTETHVNGIRRPGRGMIVTADGHVALLSDREFSYSPPGSVFILC